MKEEAERMLAAVTRRQKAIAFGAAFASLVAIDEYFKLGVGDSIGHFVLNLFGIEV